MSTDASTLPSLVATSASETLSPVSTSASATTTKASTSTTIDPKSLSLSFQLANRGPLTTIFTPPSSCLSTSTLVSYLTTNSAVSGDFTTTKIFINHYSWGDGACYPPTITTIDGSTRWANGYYYSPGICPSGWTSACSITTSPFGFATTLSTSTSAVMCCPSSWTCATSPLSITGHACLTSLTENQTLTSVWSAPVPTSGQSLDLESSGRTIGTWIVPANSTAQCDGVPVMWQPTDVQVEELLGVSVTISANSSMNTGSLTTSLFPTITNSSLPTLSPKSTDLSTGAKAGIGVTIPVVFIALALGIFFWFRRRKGKAHELAETEEKRLEMGDTGTKGELWVKPPELDGSARCEAEGQAVSEMEAGEWVDSRRSVYELEGVGRA